MKAPTLLLAARCKHRPAKAAGVHTHRAGPSLARTTFGACAARHTAGMCHDRSKHASLGFHARTHLHLDVRIRVRPLQAAWFHI